MKLTKTEIKLLNELENNNMVYINMSEKRTRNAAFKLKDKGLVKLVFELGSWNIIKA